MNKVTSKFKSHPWHGINIGANVPEVVTAFIEIVPTDTVKYEIDKASGYLKIDRPQKFSNIVPALYGFIPQTYCMENVAAFASKHMNRKIEKGDGDPLDICVFSEKTIIHGDVILQAIPVGGLRLIDNGEADDKIIAVLKDDLVYAQWNDIKLFPETLINRLRHYFLTYKAIPGEANKVEISEVYGKAEAFEVIKSSMLDYQKHFCV